MRTEQSVRLEEWDRDTLQRRRDDLLDVYAEAMDVDPKAARSRRSILADPPRARRPAHGRGGARGRPAGRDRLRLPRRARAVVARPGPHRADRRRPRPSGWTAPSRSASCTCGRPCRATASAGRCSTSCSAGRPRRPRSSPPPTSTPGPAASTGRPAGSTSSVTCASRATRGRSRCWACDLAVTRAPSSSAPATTGWSPPATWPGPAWTSRWSSATPSSAGRSARSSASPATGWTGAPAPTSWSATPGSWRTSRSRRSAWSTRTSTPGAGTRPRHAGHHLPRRPGQDLRLHRGGLRRREAEAYRLFVEDWSAAQPAGLPGLPGPADDVPPRPHAVGRRQEHRPGRARAQPAVPHHRRLPARRALRPTSGSRPRWPGWARSPARRPTRSPPPTWSAGTPSCTSRRRGTPRAAAACSARRCSAGSSRTAAGCGSATARRHHHQRRPRHRGAHRQSATTWRPTSSSPAATSSPPSTCSATAPRPGPARPAARVRTGNGIGMVVRLATSDLPRYPGAADDVHRSIQLLAPSRQALRRAHGEFYAGLPPTEPAVLAMTFSAFDDTIAPPGKHNVTVWGQWHPYALSNGEDWDAIREREGTKLVEAVDRYAPGFASSVEQMHVQTPLDLERELGLRARAGHARRDGVRPDVHVAADAGAGRLPGAGRRRALPVRRVHPPRWRRLRRQRPLGGQGRPGRPLPPLPEEVLKRG